MSRLLKIKYLAILIAGIVISLTVFYYINSRVIESRKIEVESAIILSDAKISEELAKIDLTVESFSLIIGNTREISEELFEGFSTPFIEDLNGIKGLGWVPRITESEKSAYIASQRKAVGENYKITELDSNGELVPVRSKPVYFVVQYMNPIQSNERAIGYDISSEEARNTAITHAVHSRETCITSPIKLVQEEGEGYGFLAMKSTRSVSNDSVLGVVSGVYSMNEFINRTLSSELKYLEVEIFDKTAGFSNLYSSHKDYCNYESIDKLVVSKMKVTDREWEIVYNPKEGYLSFPHTVESYMVLMAGLIITLLIVFIAYRNDSYRNSLEEKIQVRTNELELSNDQKEVLIKEIHHRVKNNLQVITGLLSLQARKITDKDINYIFKQSQYRINTMAMIHEMLYQSSDFSRINMHDYIEKLVVGLIRSMKADTGEIELIQDIKDVHLNIDTAIPLGLMINEIITNSLKYGIPTGDKGIISVGLECVNYPTFRMEIGDDGIGYSKDLVIDNSKSLGLQLMYNLADQLGGSIERDFSKKGTHYIIHFEEAVST